METKIIKIHDIKAQNADIKAAGEMIRAGALVAFPTETVYGLGANGLDGDACAKIYAAKGRPSDNPLILHIANRAMLDLVAAEVPGRAEKLLAAFCPGPITLILKRRPLVPDSITGGLKTVGLRMPDNDIARALIKSAGVPIAAPSANLSGRPSPTTAAAVWQDMQGKVPLILDGGPCRYGVESTIVDCTGEVATILRPGAITREMLQELLGDVRLDPALVASGAIPKAPGMKYTHYAPKAPLTIITGSPENIAAACKRETIHLQQQGHTVGLIVSAEAAARLSGIVPRTLIACYGRQGDLPSIAANIYEALRYFDDQPADILLGEGVPDTGLGLAIMNRLRKASGGRVLTV